ncbi:sensor histidine kinase [Aquimarina sp. 2201CG5-10]|uniref:sensor histidine kinase n=1 Tax=Aquimarina callyspongiae TaxID=3098150 RepID=UPI002AB380F0|nr:sensor histidine kinase [Aquimarina sp. 2201CG5-10]MDY8138388.1 sensor histidine kinase [Aquimarina sp. 2201CG5-10]
MLQRIRHLIDITPSNNYTVTLKHHFIFWFVYFLFTTFRWGSYFNDYIYSFKTTVLGFAIHMTLSYFNIYYLMPKFIHKRKYLLYTLAVILSLFIMLLVKFYLTYFMVSHNVWPEGPEVTTELTLNYAIEMMLGELYVMAFVAAIKVTLDWLREHKKLVDVERLQLETELRFLRTQISPHFFFNTLNNIYSLSVEKSDKTPKTILKLSELMRYILHETNQKRQSLTKEIICLQNYLDLERIRYGDSLKINTNISGEIEGKEIAPMLLLSFIENSFKHGANKNVGAVEINIDFKVIDDFLYFRITNPIPLQKDYNEVMSNTGGIGIENVKKRLELGYQKEEYHLDIHTDNDLYVVDLKIKV